MNGRDHLSAEARIYGLSSNEYRTRIGEGIGRAADMARVLQHQSECDQLTYQLTGVIRTIARLREQLPEGANG